MGYKGEYTPNYGMMGMETSDIPQGTGRAVPYGQADPTSQAPLMALNGMGGNGVDSAQSNIGYRGSSGPYRPEAGRADRLSANIVGGGTFDDMASGGYSSGATHRM